MIIICTTILDYILMENNLNLFQCLQFWLWANKKMVIDFIHENYLCGTSLFNVIIYWKRSKVCPFIILLSLKCFLYGKLYKNSE